MSCYYSRAKRTGDEQDWCNISDHPCIIDSLADKCEEYLDEDQDDKEDKVRQEIGQG